ncbi:cell wall hydrolase [Desulforhabdus amnigena]|uniref:Cell wall hydrolase SleB domain-containing protein n=1 Tax=Desulforhabdus amnigena TaxID=40218 RepID=A0A9W6L9P7_9BACT|nr:cell wall hydrolase [Desulforhabdus amnigena]GLI35430.1 hypothetical protein DAMNIGENAA_28630 [Desulforhabdus amnigena]
MVMLSLQELGDAELLARCIYGEARGEGLNGMIAVGHVVMNRYDAGGRYGVGLKGVILKPRQFSCFNSDDPNFKQITQREMVGDLISVCRSVADLLLEMTPGARRKEDPTHGATHYHAASIRPYWAGSSNMTFCVKIGNHLFWKEG